MNLKIFFLYQPNFIFDNILYKQIEKVAVGSPLGPLLANVFLVYHEQNKLDSCHLEYGIRLSHIFKIPSISNEKPGISIKIPSISIKNLGFQSKY